MVRLSLFLFTIMVCVKTVAQFAINNSFARDSLFKQKVVVAIDRKQFRLVYRELNKNSLIPVSDSTLLFYEYLSALKSGFVTEADVLFNSLTSKQKLEVAIPTFSFIRSMRYSSSHFVNVDNSSTLSELTSTIGELIDSWDTNNYLSYGNSVFKTSDSYSLASYHNVDKRIVMYHAFGYKRVRYDKQQVICNNGIFNSLTSEYERSYFQYYLAFDFYINFNWLLSFSSIAAEENLSGFFFDIDKDMVRRLSVYEGQSGYNLGVKYQSYLWDVTPSIAFFETEHIHRFQIGAELKFYLFGNSSSFISSAFYINNNRPFEQLQLSHKFGLATLMASYSNGEHNYLWNTNGIAFNNSFMHIDELFLLEVSVPLIKKHFELKFSAATLTINTEAPLVIMDVPIEALDLKTHMPSTNSVLNVNTSIIYNF